VINKNKQNKLLVFEKYPFTKFLIEKKDNNILFYKKHNKPITLLDKVLTKIYNFPLTYFSNFNIPENFIFSFYYFYDNSFSNTIPKNKLVLKLGNVINNLWKILLLSSSFIDIVHIFCYSSLPYAVIFNNNLLKFRRFHN
jgi:hypothetical protein